MEEVELIENNEKLINYKKRYSYLSLIIFIIILFIFSFFQNLFQQKNFNILNENLLLIPNKFLIDKKYLFDFNENFGNNFSFISSFLYNLEQNFKFKAIELKILKDNEFILFSSQYLLNYLNFLCLYNSEICNLNNLNLKNFLNLFQNFSILKKILIPLSKCNQSFINNCPLNTPGEINKNFISFELNNFKNFNGINNIKNYLFKLKKPLLINLPIPNFRYYFKCENNSKNLICFYNLSNKFSIDFEHDFNNNINNFFTFNTNEFSINNIKTFNLIGFNDNFIENNIFNKINKGSFIIRGSWGSSGHSYEYLNGLINKEIEDLICPNIQDPLNWIPASKDCILTDFNPDLCLIQNKKKSTELICINSLYCNLSKRYVLLKNELNNNPLIKFNEFNVPYGVLLEFTNFEENLNEISFLNLPFNYLYKIFQPLNFIENNPFKCGYNTISYDLLNQINFNSNKFFNNYEIINFNINWNLNNFNFKNLKFENKNLNYLINYFINDL